MVMTPEPTAIDEGNVNETVVCDDERSELQKGIGCMILMASDTAAESRIGDVM